MYRSDAIDQLVDFAVAHPEAILWSMRDHDNLATLENTFPTGFDEHPHFSSFMVGRNFKEVIGDFDENFQSAYYEDNDIHARIVLSGNKALRCFNSVFFHYGSIIIRTDDERNRTNTTTFQQNQEYFKRKWGRLNVNEPSEMAGAYYSHPFNKKENPLSFWTP